MRKKVKSKGKNKTERRKKMDKRIAVRVHEHGGPEVLKMEEIDIPEIGPNDVLVEIKAVGMNHMDLWMRQGIPGFKIPLPLILGCDTSGVVKEVGSAVEHVKPGMEYVLSPATSCGVCEHCVAGRQNLCKDYKIFGESRDGGYTNYQVYPAINILPKPENLSFEEAAAMPLVFLTAWQMLVTKGKVKAGDFVVIHAAGSGVGSAGIQIAKMHHAIVIATAGSDEKLEKARELGADFTLNYSKNPEWWKEIRKITAKKGADIVFEHIGESTFEGSLNCLAKGGKIVVCGATSGYDVKIDLRKVFFKNVEILGSTMANFSTVIEILKLAKMGILKPVIDRIMPLSEAIEAHKIMENRAQFGKIILIP